MAVLALPVSVQGHAVLRARNGYGASLPEHRAHADQVVGDPHLHQLLLQHLHLLQHGLQVPRDGERTFLQRESQRQEQ